MQSRSNFYDGGLAERNGRYLEWDSGYFEHDLVSDTLGNMWTGAIVPVKVMMNGDRGTPHWLARRPLVFRATGQPAQCIECVY